MIFASACLCDAVALLDAPSNCKKINKIIKKKSPRQNCKLKMFIEQTQYNISERTYICLHHWNVPTFLKVEIILKTNNTQNPVTFLGKSV